MSLARELWKRIETIHAVTYFSPESIAAAKEAGLRGFWMGYFGFRASPLGPVQPGVAEAAFANFAPGMVRRSLPDAWSFAQPADLVGLRADAAASALRRLSPDVDGVAGEVNATLRDVVDQGVSIGRPLFAANRDLDPIDDEVAQLWQHCTTLREHRGDGHVMALATSGIDGCAAHRLLIADQGLPEEVFRDNRGWTEDEWDAAARRLERRGLLDDTGAITDAGRQLRGDIEALTDSLADEPLGLALDRPGQERLIEALTAPAESIAASGTLPFPNPMGLPSLGSDGTQ